MLLIGTVVGGSRVWAIIYLLRWQRRIRGRRFVGGGSCRTDHRRDTTG